MLSDTADYLNHSKCSLWVMASRSSDRHYRWNDDHWLQNSHLWDMPVSCCWKESLEHGHFSGEHLACPSEARNFPQGLLEAKSHWDSSPSSDKTLILSAYKNKRQILRLTLACFPTEICCQGPLWYLQVKQKVTQCLWQTISVHHHPQSVFSNYMEQYKFYALVCHLSWIL